MVVFILAMSLLVLDKADATCVTRNATADTEIQMEGYDWTNPSNVYTSNNVYATETVPAKMLRDSNGLYSYGYGFNIPTGATIDGLKVEVERKRSTCTGGFVTDNSQYLTKDGTDAYDSGDSNLWSTTEAYVTWGSATNKWGTTWTVAQVNANEFGYITSISLGGGTSSTCTASIDHIRITVCYTYTPPPSTGCSTSSSLLINNFNRTYLPYINIGECQVNNNLTIGYSNLFLWTYPFININSLGGLALKIG